MKATLARSYASNSAAALHSPQPSPSAHAPLVRTRTEWWPLARAGSVADAVAPETSMVVVVPSGPACSTWAARCAEPSGWFVGVPDSVARLAHAPPSTLRWT